VKLGFEKHVIFIYSLSMKTMPIHIFAVRKQYPFMYCAERKQYPFMYCAERKQYPFMYCAERKQYPFMYCAVFGNSLICFNKIQNKYTINILILHDSDN
jgi:hypothetical protein